MILRTMLFVPGNSPRMIAKAALLPADAVILDLEDAVPHTEKVTARAVMKDSIAAVKAGGHRAFVRMNGTSTGMAESDLDSIVCGSLDGVLVPKAESCQEMLRVAEALSALEEKRGLRPASVALVPLIETAKGVMNAYEIAGASERVQAVVFGAGDFLRELGRSADRLGPDQTEILFARCQVVTGARAAGVQAVDTAYLGLLADLDALEKEATRAVQLGFKGKTIVHPSHIEVVNRVFSPSDSDIANARAIVSAFEDARRNGRGAVSFEGRLVDHMHYAHARDVVDFARALADEDRLKADRP